jgi:hypothetical protein
MAIPPIEIRALWDGEDLSTGALNAKADLDALATSADYAATDINAALTSVGTTADTQLGTAVPAATDKAAVDLTTKASKFKAVGTELGTELAQGVAGGVDPATASVNVGSSLSGLLAASATTAKGAAAAVGLGLGVALISSMIKAAQAEAQALRDQVNTLLGAVEGDFKGSMRSIIRDMREELGKIDVITQLGEGDLGSGWAELERISEQTGLNMQDLVDYLQGKGTPAAQRLADEFARGEAAATGLEEVSGETNKRLALQYSVARDLVEQAQRNSKAWEEAKDAAAGLRELMTETANETERAADAAERYAAGIGAANQEGNNDYAV